MQEKRHIKDLSKFESTRILLVEQGTGMDHLKKVKSPVHPPRSYVGGRRKSHIHFEFEH